ncbi:M1 family metallopeptidase [Taibaiella soli]|uniref:M1 family peptidase n=1 Tax=Taibaiella soli TaxID=1649169 RepID=A0A2W2B4M4_9BACT|nr:M1 family metallopeptidase [Taibaiella soli]PZF75018.1 M1 family peptidase [Taibaiella soli]
MKKILLAIGFAASSITSFAQLNDNTYRSSTNPLYWQNRKPDGAYWQQDVHYTIDARIDETNNSINATEQLEYWNNSPDTLHFVYFHLWQNAFIKGSYLHNLEKTLHQKTVLGKNEAAGLGTIVENLKVNGAEVKSELDNSILKVYLPKPLLPNSKVTFAMNFTTWYDKGSTRRRMQMWNAWGATHYNGVQWFPKITVYDRKFGWDTYQHLNKEFYGDFGSYDVSLNFSSNYVVEATGVLENRSEVLPDALRAKLDIKNFANKKWNEPPSIITPYNKNERKTWRYHADNVHDFAFTADPSYRIGDTTWNGIECVAIAQEPHASGWQNGAEYVAKIIKTFSEDIGMYQYPKMVAADANDGMEYPMLTLDGGREPGYRGLLVHEIGHNWFYGMVGSNETYRAAMDEGFTQFLTAYGLRRIDGDTMVVDQPKSKFKRWLTEPTIAEERNVFSAYTYDALNQTETPINTHSNDFNDALGHEGGYRQVYFKTATMLYNLQYTLGDSLFLATMQHYFKQWRFGHPYFEDFRASVIQFTHADLNWFFDQWFETTKTIDYKIGKIRKIDGRDSFAIRLQRVGKMQMPIDFTVTAKNGEKHSFYVSNDWFTKQTDATVLPKWYGWSKIQPTYDAHVYIPSGIRRVQLDTTFRLADVDYENNYKSRGLPVAPQSIKLKLDGGFNMPNDRRYYRMYIRPDLWWNSVDGVKAGVHFEGDYFGSLHKIDATVWWNTHVGQEGQYQSLKSEGWYARYLPLSYTFNYVSPLTRRYAKLQLQINSRILDGLNYHRAGFNWLPNAANTVQLYGQTMWRQLNYDLDYLLYPQEWSSKMAHPNSSLNLAWNHRYHYVHGDGNYTFSFRAPFFTGNNSKAFNYSYAQIEAVNYNKLDKLEIRTRLFGRYGTGSNIPYESALFLAGANPEQMMEDKYTRSQGFVPDDWQGYSRYDVNHFQQGGGLNLRGYAGYFAADERNGNVMVAYKGRSGASANLEVDVDDYIPLKPRLTRNWLHADLYAFADAGLMELSNYQSSDFTQITPTTMWSDIRFDAGAGIAFTIKKWGIFDKAKPLTLRFDVPLFLNRPPYANPQYTTFRYVIGINRTF